jgi:ribosomal protein S18 acetylase RimI-like enzyme
MPGTAGRVLIISLTAAPSAGRLESVRSLFHQYADSLGFDLGFQGFTEELAGLPGDYAPPCGRLLLAVREAGEGSEAGGAPAGCVALRPLEPEICEMKRMYIPPAFRGQGLGRSLAERLLVEARQAGYRRMRLDSIDTMKEALGLYRSLGFREIPPYRYNPIPGAVYLEKDLADAS